MKRLFSIEYKGAKDLKGYGSKWQLPLLILLLLLLPVMAVIQHHNLGKLSEVKQVSIKNSLERMAENFLTDFDSEWKKIQQNFSFDDDSSTGFESRFSQTYKAWKENTTFPELIKDIYFLEFQNEKPIISIFDVQKEIFSPIDWPNEPGEKRYIHTGHEKSGDMIFGFPRPPISDKYPIITSQCHNCNVNRENQSPAMIFNFVIIVLDPDAVCKDILPSLIEKHFPAQNDFKLDIAIAKGNKPGDVLYISDPDIDITHFNKAEVRNEIRRWAEFVPIELAGKEHGKPIVKIQMIKAILAADYKIIPSQNELSPKNPDSPSEKWKLMLKIKDDTLEGIVDKARQRNLITSYCILAILGISMVMVYVSARRVGSLARRQLRFVYGVSHELRTPISVIRSAGENLADGVITEMDQQKQYGRLIRDEGRRLSSMVENILSFSALQNGKTTLNLKAARIIDILEECINSRSGSNDHPEPNIKIESDTNVPLVKVDHSSIKIALNNVIDNCIKYSLENSSVLIRIRYASSDNQLTISFEDHGRGIDDEDLPFIFDPFFRGKNTEDQRTPGSGIGLSLVNDIINKHGGRIEIKSKRHKGTTVFIILPVIRETAEV